ncbi:MAG: selenide, water dikinase SelD, partial [Desulfovibrio sp.]|nr:selenide, water dikinase SelD [Desulfovibrio sp.]
MSPGALEQLLSEIHQTPSPRVLAGSACNEDAAVLTIPPNHAIVQTVDILTPVVNDPFQFGRIAAANAISDVYAMGGTPWCAMNIACFPNEMAETQKEILIAMLKGGKSALDEASAVLAGGHTLQDEEIKYGLAVTGIIDPNHIAANDKLRPNLILLLTKP